MLNSEQQYCASIFRDYTPLPDLLDPEDGDSISKPPCKRLRWSRGSVLAFGTQVCGFTPGRSPRIFRAKKSSARLPSEGK